MEFDLRKGDTWSPYIADKATAQRGVEGSNSWACCGDSEAENSPSWFVVTDTCQVERLYCFLDTVRRKCVFEGKDLIAVVIATASTRENCNYLWTKETSQA